MASQQDGGQAARLAAPTYHDQADDAKNTGEAPKSKRSWKLRVRMARFSSIKKKVSKIYYGRQLLMVTEPVTGACVPRFRQRLADENAAEPRKPLRPAATRLNPRRRSR
jgi:hypothetical protein